MQAITGSIAESNLMDGKKEIAPPANSRRRYVSRFVASPAAEEVLRTGRIIDSHERPADMVDRMIDAIAAAECAFGVPEKTIERITQEFGSFLDAKACVMSTPIMTNAGRHKDKPLSACTVPALDLTHDLKTAKAVIDKFHEDAMGTGFDLNETEDPVMVLRALNNIAVEGAKSGKEERPVGNMAVLSVHHPRIMDFIIAKTNGDTRGEEWKFNISIDASDEFIAAARDGRSYRLKDGTPLDAPSVLEAIAQSAHRCGDPGLVFIERMNADNPTPAVGRYVSTAPCGEVGLAPGETCQFGYINLGRFANTDLSNINYDDLERLTRLMTRVLDDCLEISIARYPQEENRTIMRMKRKIGIGVCGLADFLIKLRIPYASDRARVLAQDVVTFINYISKEESHRLAFERGSCLAMSLKSGCRYNEIPGFLEEKYGWLETSRVSSRMWRDLAEKIRTTRRLRNISTISLPPTGRSGLVVDASLGIEPIFSLVGHGVALHPFLTEIPRTTQRAIKTIMRSIKERGSLGHLEGLPKSLRNVFMTALEIAPDDHLRMVGHLQKAVDESISKTINLPQDASPANIKATYLKAHELGLKGVTVFRAGSRLLQPKKLAHL